MTATRLLFTSIVLAIAVLTTKGCASREAEFVQLPGGLYFGMTQDSFFRHCRRFNAEGRFDAGRNNFVEMDLPDSIGIPAGRLSLYPVFDSTGIVELRGAVSSRRFGGWTKHLFADSLVNETLAYLQAESPGPTFEAVSGVRPTYRRIQAHVLTIVQPSYGEYVNWVMTDLRHVDELSSEAHRLRTGTTELHPMERAHGKLVN